MTLSCLVQPAADIAPWTRAWLIKHGTWDGSDFQTTLARQLKPGGTISIVRRGEAIVGWARTESWADDQKFVWPTLEAFVVPEWRRKGVAVFAACGLRLSALGHVCAVFAPSMLLVAARAGLRPTLFQRDDEGRWV